MRIGLNLLPVRPEIGGSLNYIHALVSALAEADRTNEFVLFVTPASRPLVPEQSNFRAVELAVPATWRPVRVAFENTLFRFAVARERLDCIHHVFGTLPFNGTLPTVVTVYDLLEFERPGDLGLIKRSYVRIMRRRAAARATVLAPMSHATANRLHRQLDVPWNRMEIVSPPLERHFHRQLPEGVAAFRARYALPPSFWLVVADHQPRKNFERLLAALATVRAVAPSGWPLAIRGAASADLRARIAHYGLQDVVHFVPRLDTDEMPLLYSCASALIFPSLFEGGGLPVLEALACACPVVASDIPTTLEFATGSALVFDPANVQDIARAMLECEADDTGRARRVIEGLKISSTFGSAIAAAACNRAYARAVAQRGAEISSR